ncbi:hypothetical protein OYT1_ch2362 [Ferriphaselus amnicola]|uniref:Uncharacterized protein n=1 Tax=Ferriphaselus amnicola TaxID=1188319 RepID=A0A2Z6GEP4_9PROT|nr:hypothetical protein [Ferriphaselus amnicola]BBE51877.1 hypothetical protein OYT1_ch2362 [Ferriphaselus amnicola]
MAPLISLLIASLFVSGCSYLDEYKNKRDAELQIFQATHRDWKSNGIPTRELIHAHELCRSFNSISDCALVTEQLTDIVVSISSCRVDQRSTMCKAVVALASKDSIARQLKTLPPTRLPQTPFYWSMPTNTLEVYAAQYGYRTEAARWWWARWFHLALPCLAAIGVLALVILIKWLKSDEQTIVIMEEPRTQETSPSYNLSQQPATAPLTNECDQPEDEYAIVNYPVLLPVEQGQNNPPLSQETGQNVSGDNEQVPPLASPDQDAEVKQLLKAAFSSGPTKKRKK